MSQQASQQRLRVGKQVGKLDKEQRNGDGKHLAARCLGDALAQGQEHLGEDQDDPDLHFDQFGLAPPPVVHAQVVFEEPERQFDIEASGIQLRDFGQGKQEGIGDIGHIHADLYPIAKAHQVGRAVLARSQPDQRIQHFMVAIEGMDNLVRGVGAIARDPPQAAIRQGIKEAEGEVAQIEEQQAACDQPIQKRQEIDQAVLPDLLAPFQSQPALGTQIKQSQQFAGKQGGIGVWQVTQRLEMAGEPIEFGFIQAENARSEGGEPRLVLGGSVETQSVIDQGPQLFQGRESDLQQTFDQRISAQPKWGTPSDSLGAQKAPPVRKRAHAAQAAEQQTSPQLGPGKLKWAPTSAFGRAGIDQDGSLRRDR